MYKEEKIICGVLCYRMSPNGEFQAYSRSELTNMLIAERNELGRYKDVYDPLGADSAIHDSLDYFNENL